MSQASSKVVRIDAHQHFWAPERGDYDWLGPELEILNRDFLPNHLAAILKSENITGTVLIQAAETDEETNFLLNLAQETDFIVGVVGWFDMANKNAASRIQTLSKNPYFKGIRPMIQDIPDDNWMLDPILTPTFQALIKHGLCFDALVKPQHLDALYELLQRHPKLKLVIDHGAKPDIANNSFEIWSQKISQIAQNTQAYCKLSGLITEAGDNPDLDTMTRYIDHLVTSFGPERIMWGSDWPVINLASSYREWVLICEHYLSGIDLNSQKAVWSNTAKNFYDL